jgi:hypothetical protein
MLGSYDSAYRKSLKKNLERLDVLLQPKETPFFFGARDTRDARKCPDSLEPISPPNGK